MLLRSDQIKQCRVKNTCDLSARAYLTNCRSPGIFLHNHQQTERNTETENIQWVGDLWVKRKPEILCSLQPRHASECLWTHNMLNLEADEPQQLSALSGKSPHSFLPEGKCIQNSKLVFLLNIYSRIFFFWTCKNSCVVLRSLDNKRLVWWISVSAAAFRRQGQNLAQTRWKCGSTLPCTDASGCVGSVILWGIFS